MMVWPSWGKFPCQLQPTLYQFFPTTTGLEKSQDACWKHNSPDPFFFFFSFFFIFNWRIIASQYCVGFILMYGRIQILPWRTSLPQAPLGNLNTVYQARDSKPNAEMPRLCQGRRHIRHRRTSLRSPSPKLKGVGIDARQAGWNWPGGKWLEEEERVR